MKRPAFQFYPDNWRNNANLRRCSWQARGVWIELMCLMHDSDRYGVLEWPLREVARALGCTPGPLKELVEKGVLKGCDSGPCSAFFYVPRSGRKDGDPVALIDAQDGPIWYSSRMVKDEYKRIVRGEAEGAGASSKAAPNPPNGASFGPRASSSPSPTALELQTDLAVGRAQPLFEHSLETPPPSTVPDCPHGKVLELWAEVLPELPQHLPTMWKGTRAAHLRARWRETAVLKRWPDVEAGLRYLRKFFGWLRESPFLMGKSKAFGDRKPFELELAWLVNPTNWAKVHEGKYHPQAA